MHRQLHQHGSSGREPTGGLHGIMRVRGKWRDLEIGGHKARAMATLRTSPHLDGLLTDVTTGGPLGYWGLMALMASSMPRSCGLINNCRASGTEIDEIC